MKERVLTPESQPEWLWTRRPAEGSQLQLQTLRGTWRAAGTRRYRSAASQSSLPSHTLLLSFSSGLAAGDTSAEGQDKGQVDVEKRAEGESITWLWCSVSESSPPKHLFHLYFSRHDAKASCFKYTQQLSTSIRSRPNQPSVITGKMEQKHLGQEVLSEWSGKDSKFT